MNDLYIYFIVALLPLSAVMLMIEVNPYYALVIRGILGAVAVLSYVVLGGADVALTEALMGTMLAVSLYVIAVRSSLVMRLGVVKTLSTETPEFSNLITILQKAISKVYLRLELVTYENQEALETALSAKEIHGICLSSQSSVNQDLNYEITVRIEKIWQLIQAEKEQENYKIKFIN